MDNSQKSKSSGTNRIPLIGRNSDATLDIQHFAREIVSILKDRKKVVDGIDKSKGLYPKELRGRVFKEFGVKDGNGDAKDLFDDALDKLEKKGEVRIEKDGEVKWVHAYQ